MDRIDRIQKKCGMLIEECGMTDHLLLIPHSAFRIVFILSILSIPV